MDQLRLPAVAARVVAWHNRHPLARRITAAQVVSIGYVALPYAQRGLAAAVATSSDPVLDDVIAEAPQGGLSLRERAMARARGHAGAAARAAAGGATAAARKGWKRAFTEDFIAPLKPRSIARWALRHGVTLATPPEDGPLRLVRTEVLPSGHGPATLYVLTAAIEAGGQRRRLLLGAGLKPAVLGPRLYSRARLGSVMALLLGGLLGGGWWSQREPADAADVAVAAAGAASAPAGHAEAPAEAAPAGELGASAAGHGDAAGDDPKAAPEAPALTFHTAAAEPASAAAAGHGAEAAPPDPAPAPAEAVAEAAPHEAAAPAPRPPARAASAGLPKNPLAGYPRRGRVELPNPRAMLSDEEKEAAIAARDALGLPRRESAPRPATATTATAAAGQAAAVAAAVPDAPPRPVPRAAPPPGAPAFAVSTRPLRTRTEADQVRVAMSALLATVGADGAVVEVLPQGEDWRVVGWPFDNRGDADKARALLSSRGMRVEVVVF